ncbi:FAD binding domain-containing protein [Antrihabitans sp. YC2-6]|uniref:FAD binding domain-containing protein n=1 Tax=Antrihabitans sp. YC2-6 TaxID=2799498 RepID=UPI0018F34F3C|nr:FAD binding domain-containing protein [Antrihabitans sp. YC2-6]MBJ8348929.1 FAD binding domain-containing protein [Antrihabitans sp. YC2-6]
MDLNTIGEVTIARTRTDLTNPQPGDAVIAGGTWLLSERQDHLRRLVDITTLGWEPVTITDAGIDLAATCTIETISKLGGELPAEWTAAPLFHQCATALLASFKIWKTATIGGNVSLSFPAGAMISLVTALDGTVTVWRPDGTDYTAHIVDFVTGAATNVLAPGDVLRSIALPAGALRGRTAFRKIALSPLGRSGAVIIGRLDRPDDGGGFALAVTGSTTKPLQLRFPGLPTTADLTDALGGVPDDLWHYDAHGAPDWRKAVSSVLAHEILAELS